MNDEIEQDVDQRLEEMDNKETELNQKCYYRSAARVAREIRRVAKAEKRLLPYLGGTFTLMNHAADLLDPVVGREASVELIGLLESEDRARAIQPDLPEWEYEARVNWMSACGYDNLAKATASLHGYNSEGMHECIADGIQVCRRTGKTECITCFREYATDVYAAADDLEMSMHYARVGIAHENPGPHDRRWAGAKDLAMMQIRSGQLSESIESIDRTWQLCETWHNPLHAKAVTQILVGEIAALLGEPGRWSDRLTPIDLPEGEFPWYEFRCDQLKALNECCENDYHGAVSRLAKWDRQLMQKRCLANWFENRLRILATYRLAGDEKQFQRLADQLEEKANSARDWLTLRRLKRLRETDQVHAPIPMVGQCNAGPFAPSAPAPSVKDIPNSTEHEPTVEVGETREPPEFVKSIQQRLIDIRSSEAGASTGEDSIEKVVGDLLSVNLNEERDDEETRWLLNTVYFLTSAGNDQQIWDWASKLMEGYSEDSVSLSLYARLGASLRFREDSKVEDIISENDLEMMFRKSLDLDSDSPGNFRRAGDFFRFMENLGEAERCYARGFRLDRTNADLASSLAGIYRRTERERDALTVLDMAIREGCEDQNLPWDAALLAHHLGNFETVLTYLDAFEEKVSAQPWINYYRASSLLQLERFEEALVAAEKESQLNPDCLLAYRVPQTAAAFELGQSERFQSQLTEILSMKLFEVDYLTPTGMSKLFGLLWNSVKKLNVEDALRDHYLDFMVASGLIPDDAVDSERRTDVEDDMNFYECRLRQPLDERWSEFPGRLADEADWQSYLASWGVLAKTEEEAIKLAMQWQRRAYPLVAEVVSASLGGEGYRDRAGAVWQGYREGVSAQD